jgi:hypothetical protein
MKYHFLCVFCAVISICTPNVKATSAEEFADAKGRVSEAKAREYLVRSGRVPVAKVLAAKGLSIDPAKVKAETEDMISVWKHDLGAPPWRWQDLDLPKEQEDPPRKLHPGITTPKTWEAKDGVKTSGSRGPFRLRKNLDEAAKPTVNADGSPTDDLKGTKGATIGFQNNRLLKGNGAWNSEGALAYPIEWARERAAGGSTVWTLLPAVTWKIAESETPTAKDVEELAFHCSINAYRTFPWNGGLSLQVDPYYNTDFSWDHEIYGATASLEYIGDVLGDFSVGGYKWLYKGSSLAYQARLIAKLDYSEVGATGQHTTRTKEDDWLRAGGLASLDLRFGKSKRPIEVGASYEFKCDLQGKGGSGSLFDAHVTWPLSDYTGLTLKYQKGDEPVSDQKIDQITLGMEFKY